MAVQGPESIDMSITETIRRAENSGNAQCSTFTATENLRSSDVGIITTSEGTEDYEGGIGSEGESEYC